MSELYDRKPLFSAAEMHEREAECSRLTIRLAERDDEIERLRERLAVIHELHERINELRERLTETENARDQYQALVERYCSRHDLKSCACEFGDDSDEPLAECDHHKQLRERLAEADTLLRAISPRSTIVTVKGYKGDWWGTIFDWLTGMERKP